MKKSTKNALLIALFAQKPNKSDAPFFYCASIIIAALLLIGAMVESTFLFRTSLALIILVPFIRSAVLDYKKHKETSWETAFSILLWISAFSGFFFIIGLAGSVPELVTFSLLGLIAVPIVDNSTELEQVRIQNGYCIHCGKPIDLNVEYPYCYNCFKELNSPDKETKEKYCHFCGKEAEEITFRNPVERDCYSNYLSVFYRPQRSKFH